MKFNKSITAQNFTTEPRTQKVINYCQNFQLKFEKGNQYEALIFIHYVNKRIGKKFCFSQYVRQNARNFSIMYGLKVLGSNKNSFIQRQDSYKKDSNNLILLFNDIIQCQMLIKILVIKQGLTFQHVLYIHFYD